MTSRLFFALLCLAPMISHAAQADAPPNIVMIISDDHLWSDYGFMGHPIVQTPNLDRLAAESLTFRRGYVPCSLCCPSLATIITGQFPHQHKVTSNDPPIPAGMAKKGFQRSKEFEAGREVMSRHLEEAVTLPTLLKQRLSEPANRQVVAEALLARWLHAWHDAWRPARRCGAGHRA